MKNRTVPIFWVVLLMSPVGAFAQAGNGTYTLMQDVVSSGGGQVGGGNPMSAQTALGLPAGGAATNGVFSLIGGIGSLDRALDAPITMAITVTGTAEDPSGIETVTVNGIPATIAGTAFTAENVLLTLGPNTITAVATDRTGLTTSKSITVYLDLPEAKKTPRFAINVQGTIDDSSATVSVNGVAATVASGQFSASVLLTSGLNTLTASASDPAGNTSTATIRVFVPLPPRPPAMPTVGTVGDPLPEVTTSNSITIGGTKTAGTSIWINGQEVAALSEVLTWSTTLSLSEGDNELIIVAKDAAGTPSAQVAANVVVDNLAPVITCQPPDKTNFNPFTLTGTVDDSLTRVEVSGLPAARSGKTFEVAVPLVLGANTLTVTATSPNNLVSTMSVAITRGTIPAIQSVQPADGSKLYASAAVTLQISAKDQEDDPIRYQFFVDGVSFGDWSASASQSWTPSLAQIGLSRLKVAVRDEFGGSNTKEVEVYVLRNPVTHP